jgi:uncharacterized ferritin-like protein (DUF455 family)
VRHKVPKLHLNEVELSFDLKEKFSTICEAFFDFVAVLVEEAGTMLGRA